MKENGHVVPNGHIVCGKENGLHQETNGFLSNGRHQPKPDATHTTSAFNRKSPSYPCSNGRVHCAEMDTPTPTPNNNNANPAKTETKVGLKENITILHAIAVIVSLVVGTGIYLTPQGVIRNTGSVGLSLVVWLVSGIIATLGALCFAELGTTFPGSGAHYVYLEKMYGPWMAFLYLWTMVLLVRPSLNAIKALMFAQYVVQPLFGDCVGLSPGAVTLIAVCLVVLLSFVNTVDVKLALRGQTAFFLCTISALLVIAGTGLYWIAAGKTEYLQNSFEDSTSSIVSICFALYSGTFAYAGWYCMNVLTEEMKNPMRELPLALGSALFLVTVLYLLVNLAYFAVLGPDGVLTSSAVAASFSMKSLGVGVWFVALCIAINTAGSTNVGIMVASRLSFVGARRGHLPECIGLIHIQRLTPITAVIFQMGMAIVYLIFSKDVIWLLNQMHGTVLVMDCLTVGGMLYLRYRQPKLKRPFRLPIVIPILYFLCTLGLTIIPMSMDFWKSAVGLVFVLVTGLPYYIVVVLWKNKPEPWRRFAATFTRVVQKLFLCVKDELHIDS